MSARDRYQEKGQQAANVQIEPQRITIDNPATPPRASDNNEALPDKDADMREWLSDLDFGTHPDEELAERYRIVPVWRLDEVDGTPVATVTWDEFTERIRGLEALLEQSASAPVVGGSDE